MANVVFVDMSAILLALGVGPTLSAYSCHLSLKAKVRWAKTVQTMETINMSFLTDSERELILDVLHRDEELRQLEEQRVK